MNPRPEPSPDDIIQQDILLDDIKEFRQSIQCFITTRYQITLIRMMNAKLCWQHFENMKVIGPFNYEYAYIGYDNVLSDYHKYKKYIQEIMDRLKNANGTVCDDIHNECHESGLYQYYYFKYVITYED